MKILLATGNNGKLKEMKKIFNELEISGIELLSLKDLEPVKEPLETGNTFLANAYLKVMYYYHKFNLPTISEDTGLLVKALNDEPGVNTARYASENNENADPKKNMAKLLKNMEGIEDRIAKFSTAMYYYDGKVLINALGSLQGSIALKSTGNNGFGYDPIFYLPKYKMSLAEISDEEKNKISHRGVASRMLIKELRSYYKF